MNPCKLEEVRLKMEGVLYEVEYDKELYEPSIAYTYSRTNSLVGTTYKIFVNNKDPLFAQYLFIHECGHILFSHAKDMELREDKFLNIKILGAYNKIKSSLDEKQNLLNYFRSMVYNTVMDFEVNSRMFTREEWEFMTERLNTFMGTKDQRGMWPEDFGFPAGLTWNEYLNLILLKPESFMQQLSDMEEKSQSQINKKKSGSPKEGKNDRLIAKVKKLGAAHGNSTFSEPSGHKKGLSRDAEGTVGIDFDTYTNLASLVKKINRVLIVTRKNPLRRDILYNTNRRKYDTDILIPKVMTDIRHYRANLFLLFDVSGSMDMGELNDIMETFNSFKSYFGRAIAVCWATDKVSEWRIGDKIPKKFGGGTYLALGIEYIRDKYGLKKDDVLFVISDFMDYLDEWHDVLIGMHCKKYAINYNTKISPINPGFDKIFKAL